MAEKQPQLPKDFFKQFKSKEEFNSFFNSLYKQGVEEMLKGELDEHLGYEKHAPEGRNSGNSRNGSYKKKVKTDSLGDMVLNIPRDRNSEFEPQLIPKGQRMSDKLEEAIIGMYSRGMANSDISEQVKEVYGVDVSEGTITNVLSWRNNWDNLTSYFAFPLEIRKIIYTTNTIENVNRGIRMYVKTKVQFTDDMAAQKAVYLALMNIQKKWNAPLHNWGFLLHQFVTIFENRCRV